MRTASQLGRLYEFTRKPFSDAFRFDLFEVNSSGILLLEVVYCRGRGEEVNDGASSFN